MKDDTELRVTIVPMAEQPLAESSSNPDPASNIVEPDWVIKYRSRRKGQWLRWVAAIIQMVTACFVAWIFFIIPVDASLNPFLSLKNPVIIFILIAYIGKTLVDTLFYDHYQP